MPRHNLSLPRPPHDDRYRNDKECFRATFLQWFDPDQVKALEGVGTMLFDGILAEGGTGYDESAYKVDMRSAMADLRYLESFLYHLALTREDNVIEDPSDLRVVELAAELYLAVGKLADRIEKALE